MNYNEEMKKIIKTFDNKKQSSCIVAVGHVHQVLLKD